MAKGIEAQEVKTSRKLGAWTDAGKPGGEKRKIVKQFQKFTKLVDHVLKSQNATTGEGSDATRAVTAFMRMDTIDEGKAYATLNKWRRAHGSTFCRSSFSPSSSLMWVGHRDKALSAHLFR